MSCLECKYEYNLVDRKPVVGYCGHTICSSCRAALMRYKLNLCPVSKDCRENIPSSFVVERINYKMLDFVEHRQMLREELKQTKIKYPVLTKAELKERVDAEMQDQISKAEDTRLEHEELLIALQQEIEQCTLERAELERKAVEMARLPQCTECGVRVPVHLIFVCSVCCPAVTEERIITDEKLLEAHQMCGSCYMDSVHSKEKENKDKHLLQSIVYLKNVTLSHKKSKTVFEELCSVRPKNERAELAKRLEFDLINDCTTAVNSRTYDECNELLDRMLIKADKLIKIFIQMNENPNAVEIIEICQTEEMNNKYDVLDDSVHIVEDPIEDDSIQIIEIITTTSPVLNTSLAEGDTSAKKPNRMDVIKQNDSFLNEDSADLAQGTNLMQDDSILNENTELIENGNELDARITQDDSMFTDNMDVDMFESFNTQPPTPPLRDFGRHEQRNIRINNISQNTSVLPRSAETERTSEKSNAALKRVQKESEAENITPKRRALQRMNSNNHQ